MLGVRLPDSQLDIPHSMIVCAFANPMRAIAKQIQFDFKAERNSEHHIYFTVKIARTLLHISHLHTTFWLHELE